MHFNYQIFKTCSLVSKVERVIKVADMLKMIVSVKNNITITMSSRNSITFSNVPDFTMMSTIEPLIHDSLCFNSAFVNCLQERYLKGKEFN